MATFAPHLSHTRPAAPTPVGVTASLQPPSPAVLPPPRVLVVANRMAATPGALEAVRAGARRAPVAFHLVVPATPHGLHRIVDPEVAGREEARAVVAALPVMAAGGDHVTGAARGLESRRGRAVGAPSDRVVVSLQGVAS